MFYNRTKQNYILQFIITNIVRLKTNKNLNEKDLIYVFQ